MYLQIFYGGAADMRKLLVAWHHFKTITTHRILVMQGCFRMGLYWQGLIHDLSKYSLRSLRQGLNIIREIKAPMQLKGRIRAIQRHGCIIREETDIIMNIGRM